MTAYGVRKGMIISDITHAFTLLFFTLQIKKENFETTFFKILHYYMFKLYNASKGTYWVRIRTHRKDIPMNEFEFRKETLTVEGSSGSRT